MIVKMIKYAFLVHHQDFNKFLNDVQHIGVLDITKQKRSLNEEEKSLLDLLNRYGAAIRILSRHKEPGEQKQDRNAFDILERYEVIVKEKEAIETALKKLKKEYNEQLAWGDFDAQAINSLEEKGLKLKFYTIATKRFDPKWEEQYAIQQISSIGGFSYFVVVSQGGEVINLPANEVKMPQYAPSVLQAEIDAKEAEKESLVQEYKELTLYVDLLINERNSISEKFDFRSVFNEAQRELEGALVLLNGFAPETSVEELNKYLEDNGIVYFAEEAKAEDKPPIKLKNNSFAKLFEPIGELYVPPSYTELDLTTFFAPFFVLFFGLCMGDVGYGIVFITIGFIIRNKPKFASFRPYILLMQWLGLGAVLMGLLSGGVFGTEMKNWSVLPAQVRDVFLDTDKMMIFAVGIGFVQILFGLVIKAYNRANQRGWQYGLNPISWIFILVGLAMFALPATAPIAKFIVGGGLFVLLFFGNPDAGIFGRVGHGLAELYDITGFFGDLLSYIRLFALGISGAILGMVVNKIASLALGALPLGLDYLVFGIILILGHTANMALSSLGSFVHPLRLTFVEFYKNSGFEGGGRYYTPFAKKTTVKKD